MRWGVAVFPGSCDDDDVVHCLRNVLGQDVRTLWHKDPFPDGCDGVVLPGGFSYGDYLRAGAMARFSPVMQGIVEFARGRRAGARHLQRFSDPLRVRTCCPVP